jgi:predicted MFS family arabinose efflux permease
MSGIDPSTVSKALALSMIGGLAGAAAAALKLESERPAIAVGIALVIVSDLLLIGPNAITYVCAAVLMNFAVMFVQPPYLGFLARLDNGTAAVTWGTLQESIGFMIGPFVGGLLLGHFSVAAFVAVVAAVFLGALALALIACSWDAREASREQLRQPT